MTDKFPDVIYVYGEFRITNELNRLKTDVKYLRADTVKDGQQMKAEIVKWLIKRYEETKHMPNRACVLFKIYKELIDKEF